MCGIVGVAGSLAIKHEKAFSELLIMNQLRGFDSVGVAKVGYSRLPEVEKSIDHPLEFITSQPYGKMIRGVNRVLIGHNRAATVGKVDVDNAHPFTHDHITGVHNGTLSYRSDLEDWQDFVVDSDNLYYHIAKKGVHDLWTKLFGAASLVWWDSKNETLNFLRNKDRPMYLAYEKDRKAIIWGSEYFMVQAVCYRNNIVLEAAPFATEVDKMYSFSFKNHTYNKTMVAMEEKIPSYTPAVYTKFESKYSNFDVTPSNRPKWLNNGQVIDVMFEDKYIINNTIRFEGFSPLDDRVNIEVAYIATGTQPVIDLSNKAKLYKATISSIMTIYRKGAVEWNVKVMNVHESSKTLEDVEKIIGELAEGKGVNTTLPFELPDTKCTELCSFETAKFCPQCQGAFAKAAGTWVKNPKDLDYCYWCGGFHGDSEVVYVTKDGEESYCSDCFPAVVKYLNNKNRKYN